MLNTSEENQSKAESSIYHYLDSSKPTRMTFPEACVRQKSLLKKINSPHTEKIQKVWSYYRMGRALHDSSVRTRLIQSSPPLVTALYTGLSEVQWNNASNGSPRVFSEGVIGHVNPPPGQWNTGCLCTCR